MTYFISDLHLGHGNIIGLCGRPFANAEEMDNALIDNWNHRVHKCDTVYIIGDLVFDGKRALEYLSQLKGKKTLICGNHDEKMCKDEGFRAFFEEVCQMKTISLEGHPITMCHYPMLEWKASRKEGTRKRGVLIHGHIHNRVDEKYRILYEADNAFNAGADINGFVPVTYAELERNNAVFKQSALEWLEMHK